MSHQAVTYSLLWRDDVGDRGPPFRRLAFVPAGKDPADQLARRSWKLVIHDTRPATEGTLAKGYWYVQYAEEPPVVQSSVVSTTEILHLLDRGRTVLAVSGPFETEEAAQYDMDLRWESHE